ncbi:MAG: type II secretion system protein GspL [Magnetococcus sp. DMHC-1]|nr:hypothetical protein [Magnetococcales bacterium]
MRSHAYIHLNADTGDTLTWVGPEGNSRTENAKQVAAAMSRMRVVAMVPALDVLIQSVPVPKTSRRNLVKALPFLLEEKVATPLEKLHFSLGPPLENGHRPVAVTDAGLMEKWLTRLKNVGIRPDLMVSEILLLPWKPDTWTLLLTPEQALLRTGLHTGLGMDTGNAQFILERSLSEWDQQTLPKTLQVLNCTSQAFKPAFADHPDLEIEEIRPDVDPITLMAGTTPEPGIINLLQGRFGIQGRWESFLRPFRLTAGLMALWVLIKLGIVFFENKRMDAQIVVLEARIQEIFKQAFPGVRVVQPEVQMRERMKRLRQEAGGGQEFLNLLVQAGNTVMTIPGTTVERLRYQDGLLDLYLRIQDLEQLNKLKHAIETSGRMEVNIRSAVKQDDSVESHLQIKGL